MRSVVSESGGNASLAGKARRYGEAYTGTKAKAGHSQGGPGAGCSSTGGQGVRSDLESEGHEEKYRAVVNGGHPEDEQVGQRWGKVEPALWGRRHFSFTHRTKVFAGGTIRKIHGRPQETCMCPGCKPGKRPYKRKRNGNRCSCRSRRT